MNGNRWAKQCGLPAALGHAYEARRVRSIVQASAGRGVRYLTLFAQAIAWYGARDRRFGGASTLPAAQV